MAGCDAGRVRLLASADIKADEPGLLRGGPSSWLAACGSCRPKKSGTRFGCLNIRNSFRQKVDLPAVAEPAALLAGRRTRLILPKQILHGVTVAIARESCMSLE